MANNKRNKKFYVYSFTLKKSGLFYIGATMDKFNRELQHHRGIREAMRGILEHTSEKGRLPAHDIIAKELLQFSGAYIHEVGTELYMTFNYKFFRDHCEYKIIAQKESKEEVALIEMELLDKYCDNPKCLNVTKKSHYDKRNYNV
jgi:hypothetical protein